MKNKTEALNQLKETLAFLDIAEKNRKAGIYVAAIHYSQLAIEKAAKSVIALKAEPKWTHDPGDQLKRLFPEEKILQDLGDLASEAAPWHGWSTYGRYEGGQWCPPSEICNNEKAEKLLGKAKNAITLAQQYLQAWEQDLPEK
jgi:HEPN domain-containing protein